MKFDTTHSPYTSIRNTVVGNNGMVATSTPLAAQAGLDMLKKGGNAVDAAIATAATLTVVEPTANGIGGDAFSIVWFEGKMYGLNGSGFSPKEIDIEKVKALGHNEMPIHGVLPINVPGIPATWVALSKKFGKLSLAECLEPAIKYARDGFPVAPTQAKYWNRIYKRYLTQLEGDEFKPWFDMFAPNGQVPQPGDIFKSIDQANSLEEIAATMGESFYRGSLAKKICDYVQKHGGFLTEADMVDFEPTWEVPISVNYRGYDVWEMPPNGQGIVTLLALNVLKGFEFTNRDCVETHHKQFEAIKLAFAVAKEHVTDPKFMKIDVQELLTDEYADKLRSQITDTATEVNVTPSPGGTVYLATADKDGNMVSYIQSTYMDFGSGIVVPGTGIALHNRGADFSLDPSHINALAGRKRTYHTIMPGFMTKDNQAIGPFGVMGKYMQPQGQLQVVMNTIDFNLNPQMALDAPRWQFTRELNFDIEQSCGAHIIEGLLEKGHDMNIAVDPFLFGRGQIIWRNENGVLMGATESRTDGMVAVY